MQLMKRLINGEEGQGMVEYALIVGLISIIAVTAISATGTSVNTLWGKVKTAIEAVD